MGIVTASLACFPSTIAVKGTPSVHRAIPGFIGALQQETTTKTGNGDIVYTWVSCLCYLAGIVLINGSNAYFWERLKQCNGIFQLGSI